MSAPENPQAFPSSPSKYDTSGGMRITTVGEQSCGMTLRDWFAGQALHSLSPDGVMASAIPSLARATGQDAEWRKQIITSVASSCYALADAMLAERAKTP